MDSKSVVTFSNDVRKVLLCTGTFVREKMDVSFTLKDRAEKKGLLAKERPWILSSSPAQHISI